MMHNQIGGGWEGAGGSFAGVLLADEDEASSVFHKKRCARKRWQARWSTMGIWSNL